MKINWKRCLAALLAMTMLMSLTLGSAWAAETSAQPEASAPVETEDVPQQPETSEPLPAPDSSAQPIALNEPEEAALPVETQDGDVSPEEVGGKADANEEEILNASDAEWELFAAQASKPSRLNLASKSKTIRILMLGNSFSVDTSQYLYEVITGAGYKAVVGNVQFGAATLNNHWSYINNNSGKYTYRKKSGSSWKTSSKATLKKAIQDESWDVIFLQQQSVMGGVSSTYTHVSDLAKKVRSLCPNKAVKIGWEINWAIKNGVSDDVYSKRFGGKVNQEKLYKAICNASLTKVETSSAFDLVAQTGTAIQNARAVLKDTLNRDARHLNNSIGRPLAAMSIASACGMDLSGLKTLKTSTGNVSSVHLSLMRECVANAEAHPYQVTADIVLPAPALSEPKVTESGITLNWEEVSWSSGYYILRKTGSASSWSKVADINSGDTTTWTDTDVDSGVSYTYTVQAYIHNGTSSVTPGKYDSTGRSAIFYARPTLGVDSGWTGIRVRWKAVEGAESYTVYRKAGSAEWTAVQTVTGAVQWFDVNVVSGTKYAYSVSATRGGVEGKYDPTGTSVIYLGVPDLSKPTLGDAGIEVHWGTVNGAQGYRVYRRKPGSTSWKLVQTVSGASAGSWTDNDLGDAGTYTYTVRAYANENGETTLGPYWREGTAIAYTPSPDAAVSVPVPTLAKVENTASGVAITWKQVSDVDGYTIYRLSDDGVTWKEVGSVSGASTLTWTDASVTSGKTYSYTVGAYADRDGKRVQGNYDSEDYVSTLYLSQPALGSLASNQSGITVRWNSVKGAQRYRIYRKVNNEKNWNLVETVDESAAVSWNDSEVRLNATYSYTVQALATSQGKSFQSTYDNTGKSLLYTITLDQPELLKPLSAARGIQVRWDAVNMADGYYIFRKAPGARSWSSVAVLIDGDADSWVDTKVKVGTQYRYTVRAYLERDGMTVQSSYNASGVTGVYTAPPSAISNASGVKVSWKKVSGATAYRVYRKAGTASKWSAVATVNAKTFAWVDKNVRAGTRYTYTVRSYAKSGGKTVAGSYNDLGATLVHMAAPSVASNISGVTVSWKKISGASGYIIYRKAGNAKGWTEMKNVGSGTLSWTDTRVSNGTKYTYTVRYRTSNGLGNYNASGRPITFVAAPALSYGNSGVRVRWTKVSNAAGYRVYRKAGNAKKWTLVKTVKGGGTLTWTDSAVKKGTRYTYTVRAYSKNGKAGSYNSAGRAITIK